MKENLEGLSFKERLEQIEHLLEKDKYKEAWLGLKEVETQGGLNTTSLDMGVFYYLSAVALYDLGRYDESLESGKKSFELFKNTLENKRIAQVQFTLGNDYLALGKLKQAENEFRDSIATCRRIDEEKGIILSYNKLAQISFIRSDYAQAIEYLKECIPYLEKIKDWVNLGVFQRNLGRIYTLSGELDLAEKHLLSNIKETKKAGQEINLSRCLLSLGYLRLLKREFKKASSYFLRAFQLLSRNESLRDLAIYYEYQGELYYQQKRLEEAESCYLKAIEIGEKIAPEGGIISQSYRLLAELDLKRKDLEKALGDVENSLKVSKALGEKLEEGLAYKISGEIYSLKNEKAKSREAFEKGVNLLEEINAKYEQIKIYISLSYSQGFDYPEKQNYLGKAKKLSSELGLRYFEGLSEFVRARIEFEFDNFENSIYSLDKAEKIFEELEEKENLSLCSDLRDEIEKSLSLKSLSSENEFKLFRKYFSDTEYQDIQEGSLEERLMVLASKIQAERGFIVYRNGVAEEPSCPSLYNIEPDKARNLAKSLVPSNSFNLSSADLKNNPFKPLIFTHPTSVQKVLENGKINSLLLIPLLTGEEVCGFIYLDRVNNFSSFTQKELNFAVAFSDLLALKLSELQKKSLQEDNFRLRKLLEERCSFSQIITRSSQMLKILWKLEQIKDTNLSVLFEGETGTGKDFLGKALHYSSSRKDKNFVAVNCAALPEPLLESELFGHKKGSYTGATFDKKGLFEEADGGTLYLDEIGDLSPSIQVKLLRVLEEKVITRLGETKPKKIDIRIVASTNKNLEEEVAQGRFRKDLYFRLNAVNLKLPPLRERREDIPLLVDYFIKTHSKGDQKALSLKPLILELCSEYDWPGNVR
ncbi:MAG: sigma 54-interacting transcriptional regulator, partial [candidate division Zixibacteria bacterium]|nr:sigma 54-interacting transcriptional regulator [candidate division Zixibacteria bacterium]